MTSRLRMSDFSVRIRLVDTVDNQGEPCVWCADVFAVVEAIVYGSNDDGELVLDCCASCVSTVIVDRMLVESPIHVELAVPEPDDDRMTDQDDTRPHPDGE